MFGTKVKIKNKQLVYAEYDFAGDANDISGNGNNGTVFGATLATDEAGNANKAYNFDNVNDYIRIPHNSDFNVSSTKSLAVEMDFFVPTTPDFGTLFHNADSSGNDNFWVYLRDNNPRLQILIRNGATNVADIASNNINYNDWNNLKFWYDNTDASFGSLNVDLNGEITTDLCSNYPKSSGIDDIFIGRNVGGSATQYFGGKISHLKISETI